jgi:hypothetical protein
MSGRKSEAANKERPPITIDKLWELLAHNDLTKVKRLSGFRRLAAICRSEFSTELDHVRKLDLLRGLLSGRLEAGTDRVDNLELSEAAQILEDAARQIPSKKLLDRMPAACLNCGQPLSDADRAWRQAWCDECRQTSDKVLALDIAFRTEPRSYNRYGRDPLERFPEWHIIITYICNKYNIFKVENEHWDRFINEYQTISGIDREGLLGMRRSDLASRLGRPADPPPTSPTVAQATHAAKGTPGGSGRKKGQPLTDQEEKVYRRIISELKKLPHATTNKKAKVSEKLGIDIKMVVKADKWGRRHGHL